MEAENSARLLAKKILNKRRSEEGIYHQVYKKVVSHEARLPSLPDVAQKVRHAIANDGVGIKEMARIIQADPALAARIIRSANSPLYRSTRPFNNVADAVKRMGTQVTRNLVYSHSLATLFSFRQPVLRDVANEVWQDSVQTAAIAAVLASYSQSISADKALLAALLQDIGVLPLLVEISDNFPDIAKDPEAVRKVVNDYKSKVGFHLLKVWGFDDEFLEVARSRYEWLRTGGSRLELADVILLARWHACIGKRQLSCLPRVIDMPAYQKFPVNMLSPEQSLQVLEQASEQLQEITRLFGV